MNDADHLWNAVAQVLRAQVSEAVWHSSFQDARPLMVTSTHLTMAVPSSHVRDRLDGRYMALIRDALTEVGRQGLDLDFVVTTPHQESFEIRTRLGPRLGVAPEHLETVARPAPVAGRDAAADLAEPEIRPIDRRENVALPLRDEEHLLAEVRQVDLRSIRPLRATTPRRT